MPLRGHKPSKRRRCQRNLGPVASPLCLSHGVCVAVTPRYRPESSAGKAGEICSSALSAAVRLMQMETGCCSAQSFHCSQGRIPVWRRLSLPHPLTLDRSQQPPSLHTPNRLPLQGPPTCCSLTGERCSSRVQITPYRRLYACPLLRAAFTDLPG